jgi:hypothetical protein
MVPEGAVAVNAATVPSRGAQGQTTGVVATGQSQATSEGRGPGTGPGQVTGVATGQWAGQRTAVRPGVRGSRTSGTHQTPQI